MITSPITFVATSNAALYLNSSVNFADVDEKSGIIDISKVNNQITDKTKLIVPVHYGGYPANLKELYEIASENNIKVIEDAAHALGAEYQNKKIGSLKYSEMAMFSFHPVKHITTGEGGAIVTNNKEYFDKLKLFRSHGITKEKFKNRSGGDWYHEMHHLGYNYRITDIQASLGISQLEKLDNFIKNRRKIASIYNELFEDNPYFDIILEEENSKSAYHLYPILLKCKYLSKKAEIFSRLRNEGLGVQVHYIPVYLQPYYQSLGYTNGLCPNSEKFYNREISIPMYPTLTEEDIDFVNEKLFKVFKEF